MSSGVRFTVAVIVVAMFASACTTRGWKSRGPAGRSRPDGRPSAETGVRRHPYRRPTRSPSRSGRRANRRDRTGDRPTRNPPSEEAKVTQSTRKRKSLRPHARREPTNPIRRPQPRMRPWTSSPSWTPEPSEVVPRRPLDHIAYGPSLGVRETGVSLLSAVPLDDEPDRSRRSARTILRDSASRQTRRRRRHRLASTGAWNTIRGAGEMKGSSSEPDGSRRRGARFLLVRDDSVGGLRLDGRISGATVREDAEGRPEVAYLLESDAVDEVREATFDLVGGTVAWIVDGESRLDADPPNRHPESRPDRRVASIASTPRGSPPDFVAN